MAAITLKQYNAIRKAARDYKGTRGQLAAEHGVSERTLRKILAAETWKEYREKNVVTSRKAQAAHKAKQAAESIPPWEDAGRALEDDLVMQDPDVPAPSEDDGGLPPITVTVSGDMTTVGRIGSEVCRWIREAADRSPELRGIIGALAVWSPEHFTEHLALLQDSLENKYRD